MIVWIAEFSIWGPKKLESKERTTWRKMKAKPLNPLEPLAQGPHAGPFNSIVYELGFACKRVGLGTQVLGLEHHSLAIGIFVLFAMFVLACVG